MPIRRAARRSAVVPGVVPGVARESADMDSETFVRTAPRRAGLPETREGAAAVREAVEPGEFANVLSQLPREHRELVGPMS
jgi:uncharacterized protein (DUF2267 family)